jgi:cyclopropane-fatty-acyl-phospholipid synthase
MALAEVFEALAGPDAPVEFRAYDDSQAGTAGSAVKIAVRSLAAAAYLAQAPGGVGLARAYVAGHLDVEGDMYEALARMTKAQSIVRIAVRRRGERSGTEKTSQPQSGPRTLT